MRKQKSQSSSQNSGPVITKSCQSFLGRDPIQSPSIQYDPVPRPKSFKDFDEENNFQDLTTAQKKQVSQALKKELKIHNKDIKQEKNKFNGENRKDRHFTDDILQSEEVSMADSSQEPPPKNNRKEQDQGKKKKKSYFNLILLGAASTGKTTFMECFLRQYKQKNQQITIKQHTSKIIEVKSGGMFSNLSQQFYIIDTPGFTHSTINSYSQQIQAEIRNRIENTRKNRKDALTVSAVYESEQREIRDQRIHCCLFFFRGPRMHSDDWKLLQQLHDKCNIIPVIAKGDSYTIQQVIEIKKNIRTKAKEKAIQWFDIQEYIRQKHPSFLNSIIKGPYGISPPFMIASSTNVNVDVKLCREYKWGKCLIQNCQHTDFQILYQILTKYLAEGFVKMIDVMEDTQKAKLESQKIKNVWKYITFGGIITCFLVIGSRIAQSHNIKN